MLRLTRETYRCYNSSCNTLKCRIEKAPPRLTKREGPVRTGSLSYKPIFEEDDGVMNP